MGFTADAVANMDSTLLKQAIEDAKAVRMLCLAWTEGQFYGHMKYVSHDSNEVERASCNCRFCGQHGILLEASASHAKFCTEPKPKMPISFSEAIEQRFPNTTYRL